MKFLNSYNFWRFVSYQKTSVCQHGSVEWQVVEVLQFLYLSPDTCGPVQSGVHLLRTQDNFGVYSSHNFLVHHWWLSHHKVLWLVFCEIISPSLGHCHPPSPAAHKKLNIPDMSLSYICILIYFCRFVVDESQIISIK